MASHPKNLWVIINHDGRVMHQTFNPAHLSMMRRYVKRSREAGDDWELLQYLLDGVVKCEGSLKETVHVKE